MKAIKKKNQVKIVMCFLCSNSCKSEEADEITLFQLTQKVRVLVSEGFFNELLEFFHE